ncbi:MAG TPA: hypothetical protein VMF30_17265 [Pirellulales bacterium]|nr:hypothetical protein [Pirellulales bacterium]
MVSFYLLAKDWKDVGPQVLVGVIMVIFYVVNHLISRERKGQAQKSPRPVQGRPPVPDLTAKRPVTPVRPAPPGKPDPLLAEIQKFLKQSNADKRSPARPQPPTVKPIRVEPIKLRPEAAGDFLERPLEARHLDTSDVGARASQLTDDLKRADVERQQHFQQTFTHKVGRLTDTSTAAANAEAAKPAANLPAVPQSSAATSGWLPLSVKNTDELRRAFILNEILQRPEQRWES